MTPPPPIRNAALAASAGTGKTFALSNRYLALLAAGAEPASIVALTFTRKAAGEILSRILTRLAAAAASPAGFAELTERLTEAHLPAFADRPAVQAALRSLVQSLPLLRIGTLDSFFLQILRPFRLEAGIAAELAISSP
ncbi:MAG: UvrD-helicase domain-containing protein, partial [Kiritimatiellia bacterium]|nr:UvrD-helicase domain-containing protein [Kiritimatiellia bacterium]